MGFASLTVNARPSSCDPFSCAIALSASSSDIVTKPKPFERPVSRSVMMVTASTVPQCEKALETSFSVVWKKMFVGNLSFQTTENDVSNAFSHCGTVEAVTIITDRDTGRSKGFGFVTMSEEDADKAIAQLNGSQLDGRALTVNEAKPMVKRDFGGGGRNGGGGGGRNRY